MELVELGTILEMTKGKKPVNQSSEQKDGYLPYVDIDAFESGNIKQYTDGKKCTSCEEGDILIVCDGSRSGLVGRAVKGYVGSTLAKITAPGLTGDYLYYFVQGKYTLLNTRKKGTGTPHLNAELLKNQKLLVPTIEEQKQIVGRIEELFSQLDAGVETLKKTKAQLAVYRQAVLKEAFEVKIRKYPYKSYPLKELVVKNDGLRRGPFGGAIKKSCFVPSGYKVYEQGNAINDTIAYGRYYISEQKYQEMQSFHVVPHDLLVSCSGTLGRITELPDNAPAGIINQALLRIRLNRDIVNADYFIEYFRSGGFQKKIVEKSQGSAMANLVSIKEFKEIKINVPEMQYQQLLLSFISEKLSVCESIEQTVDTALHQADALRQSILKKAFEGGL